jgi:polyketide cyclase/dehydrase/lipid transport protein
MSTATLAFVSLRPSTSPPSSAATARCRQSSAPLTRPVLGMQPAKVELFSFPTAVKHAKSLPITRDRSISLTSLAVSPERCRLITLRARGEWHFEEQSGGTSVRWSYAFEARSVFTFPLLVAVVRPLWQAYMRKALREALAQLEARNTGPHHNVA